MVAALSEAVSLEAFLQVSMHEGGARERGSEGEKDRMYVGIHTLERSL